MSPLMSVGSGDSSSNRLCHVILGADTWPAGRVTRTTLDRPHATS
jgi:hypothetical protein